MTIKTLLASACTGVINMAERQHGEDHIKHVMARDTALGALLWHVVDLHFAVGANIALPFYENNRLWTTVTSVNGDVKRIYDEDGSGEYDECDVCGKLTDTDFLDTNNECEECVDLADDIEMQGYDYRCPLDTPCLDTSMHDHEMNC